MTDLDFLRRHVMRLRHQEWFNTQPRLTHISVAEHLFLTAATAFLLAPDDAEAIKAALFHDLEEGFTGDVSALAKRLDGSVKKAWNGLKSVVMLEIIDPPDAVFAAWDNAQTNKVVKAADLLVMWMYAMEEVEMGNESIKYVCYIVETWLHKLITANAIPESVIVAYEQVMNENKKRGVRKGCVPEEYERLLA